MNLRRASLALALVSMSSAAMAAGADFSDFKVVIDVTNRCIVRADKIDFGSADDLSSAIDATGKVKVTCNHKGGAYEVKFTAGAGSGATMGARKMTETVSSDTITYSLYADAARSQVLGDGNGSTATFTGDSTTNTVSEHTIYARVPGNQNGKTVGAYSDTVIATLIY